MTRVARASDANSVTEAIRAAQVVFDEVADQWPWDINDVQWDTLW